MDSILKIIDRKDFFENKIKSEQDEILSIMHRVEKSILEKLGEPYNPNDYYNRLFFLNAVIKGFVFESNISAYPLKIEMSGGSVICNNIEEFEKEVEKILSSDLFWALISDTQ